jgi:hypothetical protein
VSTITDTLWHYGIDDATRERTRIDRWSDHVSQMRALPCGIGSGHVLVRVMYGSPVRVWAVVHARASCAWITADNGVALEARRRPHLGAWAMYGDQVRHADLGLYTIDRLATYGPLAAIAERIRANSLAYCTAAAGVEVIR